MRDSFVFYRSFKEATDLLPAEDANILTRAIITYALSGNETKFSSSLLTAMFLLIKPTIDKNNILYENGKKGGRPKSNSEEVYEN